MALEGFSQGIRLGMERNTDIRRERQQRLKNYVQGFELNAQTGEYVPNIRGMKALAIQEEMLNQQLMTALQKSQVMEDLLSKDAMTTTTAYLLAGRASDANRVLLNNPILKQRLVDAFQVNSLLPIDPLSKEDIDEIEKLEKLPLNRAKLADPNVQKALQSLYFKAVLADGTTKIVPTPHIVNTNGFYSYVDSQTREAAQKRLKKMMDILSGAFDVPEIYEAKEEQAKAVQAQAKYQQNIYPAKTEADLAAIEAQSLQPKAILEEYEKYRQENPNATIDDFLTYYANKHPDPKAQLQQQKLQNEVIKEQLKVKKAELDTKKAEIQLKETIAKLKNNQPVSPEIEQRLLETLPYIDLSRRVPKEIFAITKKIEAQNKKEGITIPIDQKKQIMKLPILAKRFTELLKEAESLPRNAWYKVTDDLNKLANFRSLYLSKDDPEDREKLLAQFRRWQFKSKLGQQIADYILTMSGQQLTDAEFERRTEIVTGGNWNNKESFLASLSGFTSQLIQNAEDNLNSVLPYVPYTYLNGKKELDKTKRLFAKISQKLPYAQTQTQTQTQTPDQTQTQTQTIKKNRKPLDSFWIK